MEQGHQQAPSWAGLVPALQTKLGVEVEDHVGVGCPAGGGPETVQWGRQVGLRRLIPKAMEERLPYGIQGLSLDQSQVPKRKGVPGAEGREGHRGAAGGRVPGSARYVAPRALSSLCKRSRSSSERLRPQPHNQDGPASTPPPHS